jgi:type IV pilus assembly protein PilN
VAQSSTRVSSFMRNIDGSEWLRNPELEVVSTAKDNKTPGSNFTLYAQQVSTAGQDDSGPGRGKGKPGAKVMASRGAQ